MNEIPVTPDVSAFVAKIYRATTQGALEWETTNNDNVLIAGITGDYAVKLTRVGDLDGEMDSPDHLLSLLESGKELFTVSRKLISAEDLATAGIRVKYSYQVFSELWSRAWLKAQKVEHHIKTLNEILDRKIGASPPDTGAGAGAGADDDDVPF